MCWLEEVVFDTMDWGFSGQSWAKTFLPDNIFRGRSPSRLSVVGLSYVQGNFSSPIFAASLRELSLKQVRPWNTISDIAAMLRLLNNLEAFTYRVPVGDKPLPPGESPMSYRHTATMTRMKSLKFEGALRTALALYTMVAIPATASVIFDCLGDDDSDEAETLRDCITWFSAALNAHYQPDGPSIDNFSCLSLSGTYEVWESAIRIVASKGKRLCLGYRIFQITFPRTWSTIPSAFLDVVMSVTAFNKVDAITLANVQRSAIQVVMPRLRKLRKITLENAADVEAIGQHNVANDTVTRICCDGCIFEDSNDLQRLAYTVATRYKHATLELSSCTFRAQGHEEDVCGRKYAIKMCTDILGLARVVDYSSDTDEILDG